MFATGAGRLRCTAQLLLTPTHPSLAVKCIPFIFSKSTSTVTKINVDELLETPTWSVESLIKVGDHDVQSAPISSHELHHLLRLSALPPPTSSQDEARMLETLAAQLHFVNDIRKADTTGVKPLQSLRDETAAGNKAEEVGLDDLEDAFAREELKGSYHQKIRRSQDTLEDEEGAKAWDVLGSARKRVGRYFVVEGGKAGAE